MFSIAMASFLISCQPSKTVVTGKQGIKKNSSSVSVQQTFEWKNNDNKKVKDKK